MYEVVRGVIKIWKQRHYMEKKRVFWEAKKKGMTDE